MRLNMPCMIMADQPHIASQPNKICQRGSGSSIAAVATGINKNAVPRPAFQNNNEASLRLRLRREILRKIRAGCNNQMTSAAGSAPTALSPLRPVDSIQQVAFPLQCHFW